jgi:hypothetical protein
MKEVMQAIAFHNSKKYYWHIGIKIDSDSEVCKQTSELCSAVTVVFLFYALNPIILPQNDVSVESKRVYKNI